MQVNWMEEAGVTKRSALPALHKRRLWLGMQRRQSCQTARWCLSSLLAVGALARRSAARGCQGPQRSRHAACLLSGPQIRNAGVDDVTQAPGGPLSARASILHE